MEATLNFPSLFFPNTKKGTRIARGFLCTSSSSFAAAVSSFFRGNGRARGRRGLAGRPAAAVI